MDKSPHKSDFVSVNGINLHYLDWGGSGDVLLFLAGMGCNAHIFDDLAPHFSDKFHVMALTRRGHGESDHPETGYDVDTLTEDIRQFLDALGIDQVILAGHSMANVELSHFSALYPERVLKLIFLDAAYDRNSASYKDGSLGLSGVGSTLDEDAKAKMVEVSEPKSTPLNQFDFVIDTFCEGICPAFDKIVQDEFEPVFQCHQKRLEGSHALFLNLFYPME